MGLSQPRRETTLLEFFRELVAAVPFLAGKEVACTFAVADGTAKFFEHGLGRPWRGAWVIGNNAGLTTGAYTGDPSTAAAKLNPDKVSVYLTTASDVTIRVWVY